MGIAGFEPALPDGELCFTDRRGQPYPPDARNGGRSESRTHTRRSANTLAGRRACQCPTLPENWRKAEESNPHPFGATVFRTVGRPFRPCFPHVKELVPGERFELITNPGLSRMPLPLGYPGKLEDIMGVEPIRAGLQPAALPIGVMSKILEGTITARGVSP